MNKWTIRTSIGLLIAAAIILVVQLTSSKDAVITIDWTTGSELNTAGFNLYRSEDKSGTYTRINTEMIPGSTDPLTGGSYTYTDTHVVAGHTYYYQLEDIELSGAATRHEPYQVTAGANLGPALTVSIVLIGAALLLGIIGLRGKKSSNHA